MSQTDALRASAPVVFALSSNDEHGTVRVLHHPGRHAPDEEPVNGAQPLGPHHDQIGTVFGGHLHDHFSRLSKLTDSLGRKSSLDQLLHALFDNLRPASFNSGYLMNGITWITLT